VSEFCVCVMRIFTTIVLIIVLIERSAFFFIFGSSEYQEKSSLAAPDFCEQTCHVAKIHG